MSSAREVSSPETSETSSARSWSSTLLNWANCILNVDFSTKFDQKTLSSLIRYFGRNGDGETLEESLSDFLKKVYPYFRSDGRVDVNNFEDVVLIASLLLHYSCVKSKDVAVHSLMCRRLDIVDQKAVAAFANNLIKYENITERNLKNAIGALTVCDNTAESIPENVSTPVKDENDFVNSSFRPPSGSPLNRITPLSVRSRKVFRLEAELGAERFDRNFLQEEVERQARRIEELEKLQSSYKDEIKRLCSEMNTAGEDQNKDEEIKNCSLCKHKDKIYKEEVRSHELEIMNLLSNTRSLEDERDLFKMKYDETNDAASEWKSQAIQLENARLSLKLQVDEMESENQTLKTALLEASQCLEEYRRQHQLNKSVECDDDTFPLKKSFSSSLISSTEDLGKAVVDVQLKEQINKNAILNNKLEAITQEKAIMNENFIKIKETLKAREYEIEELSENSKVLIQNLDHIKEDLNRNKVQLEEKTNIINNLEDNITIKNNLIENMTQQIDTLNDSVNTLSSEKRRFSNEIEQSRTAMQKLNVQIDQNNEFLSHVTEELNLLDIQNKTKEDKLKNSEKALLDCQNVLDEKIKYLKNIETCVQNMHCEINEKNMIVSQLSERLNTYRSEVEHEKDKFVKCEDELKNCNHILQEKIKLIDELLENDVNLNNIISECRVEICFLKDELKLKNDKIDSLLHEHNVLSDEIKTAEQVVHNLHCSISDKELFVSNLTEKLNMLQMDYDAKMVELDTLKNDLITNKNIIEEKENSIEQLLVKTADMNDKIDKYNDDITYCKDLLNEKNNMIESVLREKSILYNNLINNETLVSELKNEIDENKLTISNFVSQCNDKDNVIFETEEKLKNAEEEIKKYDEKLHGLTEKLTLSNEEIDSLRQEIVNYNNVVNSYKTQLETCEVLLSDKNNDLDKMTKSYEALQICIEEYKDREKKTGEDIMCLNSEIEKITNEKEDIIAEFKLADINFAFKLNEKNEEISHMTKEYQQIQKELSVITSRNTELFDDLTQKSEILNNISTENKNLKVQVDEYIKNINVKTEELVLLSQEITKIKDVSESNSKKQNIELEQKEKDLAASNQIISELQNENRELKTQIIAIENNVTSKVLAEKAANLTICELQKEKESLQTRLIEKENDIIFKAEELSNFAEEMNRMKNTSDNKFEEYKLAVEQKEKELAASNQIISELQNENRELKTQIIAIENDVTSKILAEKAADLTICKLKKEKECLQTQLIEKENDVISKAEELSNFAEEMNRMKNTSDNKFEEYKLAVEQKEKELAASNQIISELQNENHELKTQIVVIENDVASKILAERAANLTICELQKEKESIQTRLIEKENYVISKTEELSNFAEEINRMKNTSDNKFEEYKLAMAQKENELIHLIDNIDILKKENENLKLQLEESEKCIIVKAENVSELSKLKDDQNVKLKEYEITISNMEKEVNNAKITINVIQHENEVLKQQIVEEKMDTCSRSESVMNLTEKIEIMEKDFKESSENFKIELSLKDNEITESKNIICELQNRNAALKTQILEHENNIASKINDITNLTEEIAQMKIHHENILEDHKTLVIQKEKEIFDFIKIVNDLKNENETLTTRMSEVEKNFDVKTGDLSKLTNNLEEYKFALSQKEIELNNYNDIICKLKTENDMQKIDIKESHLREVQDLEIKIKKGESELNIKSEEIKKLIKKEADLLEELSSHEIQQEKLSTDICEKQNTIESLNEEINRLQKSLDDALLDVQKLKDDLTEKSKLLLNNNRNEISEGSISGSAINNGNDEPQNSKVENETLISVEENLSFEEFENDLVFYTNTMKKSNKDLEMKNGYGEGFEKEEKNLSEISQSTELIAKACAQNILEKEDIILSLKNKCQNLNRKVLKLSANNEQLRMELSLLKNETRNTSSDIIEIIEQVHEYAVIEGAEGKSIADQHNSVLQHSSEITSTENEEYFHSTQCVDKTIWSEVKEFIAKSFDQLAKIHVYLTPHDDNLSIGTFLSENQGESFLTSIDSVESIVEKHADVETKTKNEPNWSHVYSFINKSLMFLFNNFKFILSECINLRNQLKSCEEKRDEMSLKYLEAKANEVDAKQKFTTLSEITLDIKREYFEHETELTKTLSAQVDSKNKLNDLKQILNGIHNEMFNNFNNMEVVNVLYEYQRKLESCVMTIEIDLSTLDERAMDNLIVKKWFYNKMDILIFKLDEKYLQESQDIYLSLRDNLDNLLNLSESIKSHFDEADSLVKDYTNYLSGVKNEKVDDLHVFNKKNEFSLYEKLRDVHDKYYSALKDNDSLNLRNVYLNERLTDLSRVLKEVEARNSDLTSECNSLRTSLESRDYERVLLENNKLKHQIEDLMEKLNDVNAKMYMGSVKPLVEFDKILQENMKLSAHAKKIEAERDQMQTEFNGLKIVHARLLSEHQEVLNRDDTNKLVADLRSEYEDKLNRMKQKMKQLYQQQISVMTKTHQDELETTCKKYVDKIKSYETHVNQLSSELWKVGEKLLMERNEKDWYKQQIKDIRSSRQSLLYHPNEENKLPISRASSVLKVFDDSVKDILGSARKANAGKSNKESGGLHMSDEESELFDNTYLTDLKAGICEPRQTKRATTTSYRDKELENPSNRLSELQWRNSMCLPHLKSSYPAETQFQKVKEEEVKMGAANLDDSLFSEKTSRPKKEVGQTAYKKPGPPTPSKKGGRQSLQGSDFREPLREHNENLSKKTSTPSRIRSLFMGNNSKSSKDENTFGTPKARRMSIFRKPK